MDGWGCTVQHGGTGYNTVLHVRKLLRIDVKFYHKKKNP